VIDGLAVVDKPAGMTSHDVVARCRRIFSQRRVGHGGTLDPDATGVLLVALGRGTRLLQWVSGMDKTYTCRIVLGVATTTLDAAGDVTGTWDMAGTTLDAARSAAGTLTGTIDQVPPMVSAIKIAGRRLHELAREGIEVDRPARRVRVDRFDLDGPLAGGAPGTATFSALVACSSGTYVRSLAADLGAALGGGAHLTDLRRTSIGRWGEADATPLDALDPAMLRPVGDAVAHLDRIEVGPGIAAAVGHGKVLGTDEIGAHGSGPWAVFDDEGALLAVYAAHGDGRAKPSVVLTGTD
jgi:tRNA pseudouridine55 synthase